MITIDEKLYALLMNELRKNDASESRKAAVSGLKLAMMNGIIREIEYANAGRLAPHQAD